jgi:hypothetical protein
MTNTGSRRRHRAGAPSLDLIEESVGLLRQTPLATHLAYYVGAIPFWIGLLYFISDMTRNAYAADRLADASLGMALLYLWNKCWQTVYATRLRAVLEGRPDEPWTRARILRMIAAQASLQPWGLIVRPIAAIITVPFVWISNFYQCVTIVGDGSEAEGSVAARAWAQARLWPKQAHSAVSIVYLFTIFVWLNICIVLGVLPVVLKMFFAVETDYSRGVSFYFNTTFFTATVALTSLAVDPLRKAIYSIRCFHGASLESGEDLSAEISRVRARPALAALAAFGMLLGTMAPMRAETPLEAPKTANATELDQRISEVLSRREFAWRSPRDEAAKSPRAQTGWLQGWLNGAWEGVERWAKATARQVGRFYKWVKSVFTFTPPSVTPPSTSGFDWIGLGKALLVILAGALIVLLGWLGVRFWQQHNPKVVPGSAAEMDIPDLRSEDVVANQLPEDGWIALARQHAARGELTLALRAAWLASLAHLGHRELIVILRHKTNRDYERELRRRARDRTPLLTAFDQNLSSFERSWYGNHEVTSERLDQFEGNLDQIRKS